MHPYFYVFSHRVPAYGAMMAVGLLVAGGMAMLRVRRAGLHWEDAIAILACAFGFALTGAAGLYIAISYSMEEIWDMLRTGTLFRAGRVGLVFYGGLIFAVPGVWVGARLAKVRPAPFVAPMWPCIPLGHAFGRIGCLLAGCCYGVPTDLPIGIVYEQSISGVPAGVSLVPVQGIESAALLLIFAALVQFTRKPRPATQVVALYLLLYAPCRFGLEWLRYDSIRGIYFGLSTSQWISAALFLTGMALFKALRRPANA